MAYPRRDRYDDGYFGPPPDDRFSGPPPRRHKSERHRRRSPDMNPKYSEDPFPPRRGYSRRDPPESRGMMQNLGGGRRARSPPPYYNPGPAPVPRESRKEPKHARHERDMPRDRYDRDRDLAPPRDHGSSRDKPRRSHRDEPDHRPRRERVSPPPEYRSRGREGRSHKSRAVSPEPKSRARDLPSAGHAGSDDKKSHRRPRSHDRSHKRDKSPARGRDRAVAPAAKTSSTSRRKSAPAPTTAAKKQAWWQNPLIQAGARTAFTAGAQAAMQNRNDPSPWLGSKGAKVATAALGAALMDGFGGKKKDK